jgi:hypothetical protein
MTKTAATTGCGFCHYVSLLYMISLAFKMIYNWLTFHYCIHINYTLALQRQNIQMKLRAKFVV